MTRKSKKFVMAFTLLVVVLLGVLVMKFVGINGKDMVHVGEEKNMNIDRDNVQEEQDIAANLEFNLLEQEEELKENNEKVYEDKFVDLNIEYLGSGRSSKEKYVQKTVYEDGEECALTGYHIFQSELEYKRESELWDIYDLDFVLDINEDNYYIVMYGKKICWMQYNPGRMSQFGGVEYRIGVDWESDVEEGNFFFYEIDGNQIERGYLPEEITLEF